MVDGCVRPQVWSAHGGDHVQVKVEPRHSKRDSTSFRYPLTAGERSSHSASGGRSRRPAPPPRPPRDTQDGRPDSQRRLFGWARSRRHSRSARPHARGQRAVQALTGNSRRARPGDLYTTGGAVVGNTHRHGDGAGHAISREQQGRKFPMEVAALTRGQEGYAAEEWMMRERAAVK